MNNGDSGFNKFQNEVVNVIIKRKYKLKRIIAGTLLASMCLGTALGCAIHKDKTDCVDNDIKVSQTQAAAPQIQQDDFYVDNYGDEYYLYADKQYLLGLIEEAMAEVDAEYLSNGNRTIFNVEDDKYSQFDKYDILGLLFTESSLRLIEIKDKKNGAFNVDNYERFYGKDEEGVIYYGPGMMSEVAVKYIIDQDRIGVNKFENPDHIEINGKDVKISFENHNPYDYIIQSGAKTKKEIKTALEECLLLNVKTIYIYLNRLVKDNVKAGTHDDKLQALESYAQFKHLTREEKQIAYGLIAYNNGAGVTNKHMLNGTMFDKYTEGENKGKYIINVEYAKKVMNYAKEFEAEFENEYLK